MTQEEGAARQAQWVGPRRPNQNAIAESLVRMIKEECLSRFLVFSENYLRHLIVTRIDYYHAKRSHRELEYRASGQIASGETPEDVPSLNGDGQVLRKPLAGALM